MRIAFALTLFAASVLARPDGWHRTMEDGIKAAKKSGKPVLVVTIWKEKL
ncbi:MAG: hypothetical protein ACYTGN_16355 [Planctomycetota bacterium]|jgi:hypothetical protein